MGFAGAEIFVNSSGDVMSKGRASEAIDLAKMGTLKGGGCYVYTNLKGSDGRMSFQHVSLLWNLLCANDLHTSIPQAS